MNNNDSSVFAFFGSFLLGLVLGGLIGGITALLLAPQSGEETRAMIRDKSIEIRDTARERADLAVEELRAKTDELSKMMSDRFGSQASVPIEPPAEPAAK